MHGFGWNKAPATCEMLGRIWKNPTGGHLWSAQTNDLIFEGSYSEWEYDAYMERLELDIGPLTFRVACKAEEVPAKMLGLVQAVRGYGDPV